MSVKYLKTAVLVMMAAVMLVLACGLVFAADATPPVQLHGYMQNRLYMATGTPSQFRMERLSLSAQANLPNDSNAYAELYYQPGVSGISSTSGSIYIESAYFDAPLPVGRIRVGKGRRQTFGIVPAYPNRKTSNYGIVSEAFTQDRIQGAQFMMQKGKVEFGVSAHQGYRLGVRNAGEIPGDSGTRNKLHSVSHLCFREEAVDNPLDVSTRPWGTRSNRTLEVSSRIGMKLNNNFKAGLSLSVGRLDDEDLRNLTTANRLPGTTSATDTGFVNILNVAAPGASSFSVVPLLPGTTTSKTRRVVGGDWSYKGSKGFIAQGESYSAQVSDLEYNAWNGMIGWDFASGWKFYTRYAQQNMNTPRTNNQLTWDVRQMSFSVVQPLRKGLWLQYEYELNSELPASGIAKVKNNLFFVELFSGF